MQSLANEDCVYCQISGDCRFYFWDQWIAFVNGALKSAVLTIVDLFCDLETVGQEKDFWMGNLNRCLQETVIFGHAWRLMGFRESGYRSEPSYRPSVCQSLDATWSHRQNFLKSSDQILFGDYLLSLSVICCLNHYHFLSGVLQQNYYW